jgi:sarcosine oxidase
VKAVVVGAGAWGLPAAAELARRGHDVTLVEAHTVGHPLGSSGGASRIWRLSHAEPALVRLALRSVEAWRRLEERSGSTVLLRRGLLWRERPEQVAGALGAAGVPYEEVAASEVGRYFAGLRPNGVDAVWQPDAGTLLASVALDAAAGLLLAAGGQLRAGTRVVAVEPAGAGVRLRLDGAGDWLAADVAVLAPGPWAPALLANLGIGLALDPVLEQVGYVAGRPGWEDLPCLYDGEAEVDGVAEVGLYAMPTPGLGYKIGLDAPLRRFSVDDTDRTPDPQLEVRMAARVARDFGALEPRVLASQVCTWTMSPDGRFVIDRLLDGRVVLACGDSGTGFKFSALMGEVLADLAEGQESDPDVAAFALARFGPLDATAPPAQGPPRGLREQP